MKRVIVDHTILGRRAQKQIMPKLPKVPHTARTSSYVKVTISCLVLVKWQYSHVYVRYGCSWMRVLKNKYIV